MRRPASSCLAVAALLVMLGLAHGAAMAAESAPLGPLPRWAVPQSYVLDLRVDPKQDGYSGTTRIEVALARASDHVWLHGQGLVIDKVTVTDAAGATHTANYVAVAPRAGVARIGFDAVLQPQTLSLAIEFHAPYNRQLEGLYKVAHAGDAYVMTQMEPISARNAFPCFDEPGFKTPFTLSLTIPHADVAVANTAQTGQAAADDGWKTLHFATSKPLPTYLVAWAVGPWDIVNGPDIPATRWRDGATLLRGIATRGQGQRMQRALAATPAIIEAEEDYYGFGYPFGKLDLLAAPDFSAGAMENAGLVTFRDWLLLLDANSATRYVQSSFNVIAHELAHQWTGDTVTLAWWNDLWLNESFATWMQQKVATKLHPEYRTDLDRVEGAQYAMANDSLVSARRVRQPITGNGDIDTAFDSITYQKGAAVLGMFEHYVGEDVFRNGMRAYVRQHRFGNADADDLVDAIATAAGKGEGFRRAFRGFLDQAGVPLITTRLDCSAAQPVLHLAQSRYLPVGSEGDPKRTWGVPVCVRFGGPEAGVQCTMLEHAEDNLHLDSDTCPAWYLPNADASGYYRFAMTGDDAGKLARVVASLGDGEQLAWADAIDAGFRRGNLDAADVLAMMRTLAPSKTRQVALAPLATVEWLYRHGARDDAARARIAAAASAAYLPRLAQLGYQRKSGESDDDALLRASLATSLGLVFRLPEVRNALLVEGDAAMKPGKDGRLPLGAANPDLLGAALSVAVQEHGRPAVDALIAAIDRTTDAAKRNAMLEALGKARGADGDRARDFAVSRQVKVGEMAMVLRGSRETAASRDELWRWFTHHYEAVRARTGSFAGGKLPGLAGGDGCSRAEADRLGAFFTPHLAELPGADRGLAQTRETILLCSALRASQEPAATTRHGDGGRHESPASRKRDASVG
jgi:alanyl aminopeptidase